MNDQTNASSDRESGGKTDFHILQVVGWPVGGIRLHLHTLINALSHRGVKVSYAYSAEHTDEKFRTEIDDIRKFIFGEVELSVVKRPDVSDIRNIRALYRYVIDNGVTAIHGHGAKGGLYARVVGKLANIECYYTPHGGVVHQMFSWHARSLYRIIELVLVPFTSHFIFESKYTKEAFAKLIFGVKHRNSVVLNGIDLKTFDSPNIKNDNRLLNQLSPSLVSMDGRNRKVYQLAVFGMIRREKGQHLAIQAIKEIVQKDQISVHLHLFGDGPMREELQREVEALSLNNTVTFWGDVSDVASHMKKMDIIVIPSLFESFGYVALEALLVERIIVSAKVGGLQEVLENDQAIFFEPGNSLSLASAVELAVSDFSRKQSECREHREKARSRFSATRMVKELLPLYQLPNEDQIKDLGLKT